MDEVFGAIDLSTAAAAIIALMIVGVGIAMAFKGGALAKEALDVSCGGESSASDSDGEEVDYWDGYTEEDDRRDRAAAGLD